MSQPWIPSFEHSNDLSASYTPPPSTPSDNLKFKNRFHSSFDEPLPALMASTSNLTEILEISEEEEREKEKEKELLEKEIENQSNGARSRTNSTIALRTRSPSPTSSSRSRSTSSISSGTTKDNRHSTSSSQGSLNYSSSSLHCHALVYGLQEPTSFFSRAKEWKCGRCKIKYPALDPSWHCDSDKFSLCNICFNATQVSS